MAHVVSIWSGMHRFTAFDMYPTDYFGLTLNDVHSLMGKWQTVRDGSQQAKTGSGNTSSRPGAHRHKEAANLVLPYTHHPLLPFPQGEEDSIPSLLFWLRHLIQVRKLTTWE